MFQLAPVLISTCLVLGMVRSCGCDRQSHSKQTPAGDLQSRLEAALQLTNPNTKDQSLRELAGDAAQSVQGTIVLAALDGIGNVNTRDQTARECAMTLAKAKDLPSANKVAAKIENVNTRDETMRVLAQGK